MLKLLQIIVILSSAVSLVAGVVESIKIYGIYSPWLQFFDLGDYITKSVSVFPIVLTVVVVLAVVGFLLEDQSYDYKKESISNLRKDIFSYTNKLKFVIFAFLISIIVLPERHLHNIFIMTMPFVIFYAITISRSFLDVSDIVRRIISFSVLSCLLTLAISFEVSSRKKLAMREFTADDCGVSLCIDGHLVIDRASSGIISYSNNVLYYSNLSGEVVVSSEYNPGDGAPIICKIPTVCSWPGAIAGHLGFEAMSSSTSLHSPPPAPVARGESP